MAAADTNHSYYPPGVVIAGYVPNTLSTLQILAIFTTTLTSILVPCYFLIRRVRPAISTADMAAALWFVLCGVIHLGLEGRFTKHAHSMEKKKKGKKNGENCVLTKTRPLRSP